MGTAPASGKSLNILGINFECLAAVDNNPNFIRLAKRHVKDNRVEIIESDFLKEHLISPGWMLCCLFLC
jgi:hypothetical protein